LGAISGKEREAGASFYLALACAWLLAWRCVTILSALKPLLRHYAVALNLIVPIIFELWALILWEAIVRGAGIPFLLLPPPSAIGARIMESLRVLAGDRMSVV